MTEWGIPDFTDALAYGCTEQWDLNRWHWEFVRRRQDVRDAFDAKAERVYSDGLALAERGIPRMIPGNDLGPSDRGFRVGHRLARDLGLGGLPNPRIGDQPHWAIAFANREEALCWMTDPPDTFVSIDFDLERPLDPQLETAAALLREMQLGKVGKKLQRRRRHTGKWLSYLRVLDGREAGATWSKLIPILSHRDATEQAVRDTWKQADALRFNF